MEKRLPVYGGQAVIEGVMMRGTQVCAIAVRAPDQSITIEIEPLSSIYQSKLAKVPFLRGLLILWDTLSLGTRALTFSANIQAEEDERLEGGSLVLTLIASLAAGLGLFFLLPAGITYIVEQLFHWNAWQSNFIEGLIRLGLLVGYIWAISFMPDIRRVFGYHGAEHKTINTYKAGESLEVESVMRFPREHPRCGTGFLLTVVFISILIFSALGPLPLGLRLISRLLLAPLIASLAYEYIRLTSWMMRFSWARPLAIPNLWMQRLTTREPEPAMVEVAIAAFKAMHAREVETFARNQSTD